MNTPTVAQDIALKKLTIAPQDQKPNYNWRDILRDEEVPVPEVQVLCPHGEERFDLSEVADTVGRSLANLLQAKGEKDIFNEKNQRFVADVTREVASNLTKKALMRGPIRVSLHDLYVLIEKTLVDNNAHDVAKSLLLKRAQKLNLLRDTHGVSVRLIRRNHQVVPWNEAKIEIAIRKAFLSLQKDPAPATAIARSITEELKKVGKGPLSTDGLDQGNWVIVDYGSVVVHVFLQSARRYYDLDGFWVDAPRVAVDEARGQGALASMV